VTSPRTTTPDRTRAVLELVYEHRQIQEARYGEGNKTIEDGTGPETRWLLPFTSLSAQEIELALRGDYEEFEEETGTITWAHLVREELAEAFQESDPTRLADELIQVAALCVSWVERLKPVEPLKAHELVEIKVVGNPFDEVYEARCVCGWKSIPLGAVGAGAAKTRHLREEHAEAPR